MPWRRLQGQRNATRESVTTLWISILFIFLNSNRQLLQKKRNPKPQNRNWIMGYVTWDSEITLKIFSTVDKNQQYAVHSNIVQTDYSTFPPGTEPFILICHNLTSL